MLEQNGGKADIVVCDLASKEDVAKLIPHVVNDLKRTLDIVVNCGAYFPLRLSISHTDEPQEGSKDDTQWRTSRMMIGKRSSKLTSTPSSKSPVMPVCPCTLLDICPKRIFISADTA